MARGVPQSGEGGTPGDLYGESRAGIESKGAAAFVLSRLVFFLDVGARVGRRPAPGERDGAWPPSLSAVSDSPGDCRIIRQAPRVSFGRRERRLSLRRTSALADDERAADDDLVAGRVEGRLQIDPVHVAARRKEALREPHERRPVRLRVAARPPWFASGAPGTSYVVRAGRVRGHDRGDVARVFGRADGEAPRALPRRDLRDREPGEEPARAEDVCACFQTTRRPTQRPPVEAIAFVTAVYEGRSLPSARSSPLWNPDSDVSSMNGMKKSAFNVLSHSAERTSWA